MALHQTQARDLGRVREQALAAPEDDWICEEPVLVDEPGGDELAHEPDAAGGHDVPARLGLQRSDLVTLPSTAVRSHAGSCSVLETMYFETPLR